MQSSHSQVLCLLEHLNSLLSFHHWLYMALRQYSSLNNFFLWMWRLHFSCSLLTILRALNNSDTYINSLILEHATSVFSSYSFSYLFILETGSWYISLANLELVVLWHQLSQCWDYKCTLPCSTIYIHICYPSWKNSITDCSIIDAVSQGSSPETLHRTG